MSNVLKSSLGSRKGIGALLAAVVTTTLGSMAYVHGAGECFDGTTTIPYTQVGTDEMPEKCLNTEYCVDGGCICEEIWTGDFDENGNQVTETRCKAWTNRVSAGTCELTSTSSDRCSLCEGSLVCGQSRTHLTQADCDNNQNSQGSLTTFDGDLNCLPY